jgi:nucleotide-binding universal stress UspA family protein
MLVALANGEADRGLVQYALLLSRCFPGLEVHCVHVAGREDRTADLEDCLRQRFPAAVPHLLNGDVLDTLINVTAKIGADLLLLGHSRPGTRRSLARRLAMKAPCSVWMVPDDARAALRTVLAPVDFSKRSADTLQVATALAASAGLDECIALHVYFNDAVATFEEFDEALIEREDEAFALFVAPIDLHGVYAKPLFIESADVPRTILQVAADAHCDLIVMATRGRSTSAAVLLGSVTEQVMMDTQVPLLAVKHHGAQLRLRQALADERFQHRQDFRYG